MENRDKLESRVLKTGVLLKLKTNSKKWFVLRYREGSDVDSKLEYYDDQKKYQNGSKPKRVIHLNDCFNIGTKKERKHNNVIVMYTKDDCFLIGCNSETECTDWLSLMWQLQSKISDKREIFENIWPVSVMRKGKGASKTIMPGAYRLCMNPVRLDLVRTGYSEQKYSFAFSMIRRVGHRTNVFFFEVGRSAQTGAGELYLQVEDETIAESIHCAVVNHMKTSSFNITENSSPFRNRSHSSATDRKKAMNDAKENSNYRAKTMSTSSISRSYTLSDDPHKMSQRSRHAVSCFGPSLAVAGLADVDFSAEDFGDGSSTPSSSPSVSCQLKSTPEEPFLTHDLRENSGYFTMNPNSPSYFNCYNSSITSVNSMIGSPLENSVSPVDLSDYIDMKPHILPLETVQEKQQSNQQYLAMSPISNKSMDQYNYSNFSDDNIYNEFPKRAYSVGSKSSALSSRLRCQIDNSYRNECRKAASLDENIDRDESTSYSAPHLLFDCNVANRDSSLFMEVDFSRENNGSQRPRAYSTGQKDLKQRMPTFCQASHVKNDPMCEASLHGTMPRQRCRTISQENFKSRTQSFGDSMRPRSSSSGQRSNIQRPPTGMNNLEYISLKSIESGTELVNMVSKKISEVDKKVLPRKPSLIGLSNNSIDSYTEESLTSRATDESEDSDINSSHAYMSFEPSAKDRNIQLQSLVMSDVNLTDSAFYTNLESRKSIPKRPIPTHHGKETVDSTPVPESPISSKLITMKCELQTGDKPLPVIDKTASDPFNLGVKQSREDESPPLPNSDPPTNSPPLPPRDDSTTTSPRYEHVLPALNYATLDIAQTVEGLTLAHRSETPAETINGYAKIDFVESQQRHLKTGC